MNNNNSRQPNNNNNNNRRRGRNNSNNSNRQQQNNRSGFDYNNSIDNRARGNASQMLEKYKKMASDAQFNDDRVNAEYHLQFADHYFRVLADFRSRQEVRQDQQGDRRPREDTRDDWQNEDRQSYDNQSSYDNQGSNEGADPAIEANTDRDERTQQSDSNPGVSQERPRRNDRPVRNDRPERNEQIAGDRSSSSSSRDRNGRGPRRHHSEGEVEDTAAFDVAVLPPSIAVVSDVEDTELAAVPVRKPRARRPKVSNDQDVATAAE